MTAKLADVTIENRRGVARGHAHPRGARRDADRGGDGGGRARGGGQSALLRAGRAEDIGRGDVQFGAGDRIAAIGYLPTAAARRRIEGRTLQEIARAEKKDPLDVLTDIVVADQGHTFRVSFAMSEEDVRVALRDRLVSFCTDSPAMAEDGILSKEKSHPRAWGSAPRILGTCVRELKLLPLEEAIRKMTSLPAARMHLSDRGILRPGMAADLVAFDPLTVRERSTFTEPLHDSEGIPYVAVNGQLVVDGGQITAARPGRILRGPGFRNSAASR